MRLAVPSPLCAHRRVSGVRSRIVRDHEQRRLQRCRDLRSNGRSALRRASGPASRSSAHRLADALLHWTEARLRGRQRSGGLTSGSENPEHSSRLKGHGQDSCGVEAAQIVVQALRLSPCSPTFCCYRALRTSPLRLAPHLSLAFQVRLSPRLALPKHPAPRAPSRKTQRRCRPTMSSGPPRLDLPVYRQRKN